MVERHIGDFQNCAMVCVMAVPGGRTKSNSNLPATFSPTSAPLGAGDGPEALLDERPADTVPQEAGEGDSSSNGLNPAGSFGI